MNTSVYIYFLNIDFKIWQFGGAKKDHPKTFARKIYKKNSIFLKIRMYILNTSLN